MEEKINIAGILRHKPQGIKLYSPIFGECTFCYVREDTNDICVKKHNGVIEYFNSEGLYFTLGEVMLFPSKEMRDWRKFAWKKGDVLKNTASLGKCWGIIQIKEKIWSIILIWVLDGRAVV